MHKDMRVLAIDPGYDRLGIAILEGNASKPNLIWSDCISPEKGTQEKRLAHISSTITSAIEKYSPDALGIESLFFSTNKKTALLVAEAKGSILAAAGILSLPVIECSPQQVKLTVTGYGNADKKSIAKMVPKLVTLNEKRRLDDEFDAIGIGITALSIGINLK